MSYRLAFDHLSDFVCSQRLVFHQSVSELQRQRYRGRHIAMQPCTYPMEFLFLLLQKLGNTAFALLK